MPFTSFPLQVQEGKQAQYDAFYRLSNTEQQITSYVFDVSHGKTSLYLVAKSGAW